MKCNIFNEGFGKFLRKQTLSDVLLVTPTAKYHCHRLILAFSSEYFRTIFTSEFKENSEAVVEIGFEDPEQVFPKILDFLYGKCININMKNVISILVQAEYYHIDKLSNECICHIQNIACDNVLGLLSDALNYHQEQIIQMCIDFIAFNYLHLYDQEFSWIEPSVYISILKHPNIAIYHEYPHFLKVEEYVNINIDILTEEQLFDIWCSVRFRWLNYEQFSDAIKNNNIPSSLALEAAMCFLKEIEDPNSEEVNNSIRTEKRKLSGLQFETSESKLGIIRWLGSDGGRKDFSIEFAKMNIAIVASSIEIGISDSLYDFRVATELWTQDIPASWFVIKFKNHKVVPHAYTLQHGGNYKADSLRNWDFQGSSDGEVWKVLKSHRKDSSLNGKFASYTWEIEPDDTAYKLFRILQVGRNSSLHNFLVVSGIEIYGQLWDDA
eukprot:TRINITY_DN1644_c0_g1_i1.p1 TRINITY_DN1644_c0_g1~~TRINITY_DN1644_c0_g1_i1.p1  ORF type:complete len:438 (-),score=84.55 TRINITY_DN1644_c0_g1_i1:1012-2325(-)